MTVVDWSKRVPLDLSGVQLLGASLYFRELQREKYGGGSRNFGEARRLKMGLVALNVPIQVFKKAKSTTISSFVFEWHHLFNNQWIVAYLKPRLPEWAYFIDQTEPIQKLRDDKAITCLKSVFQQEYRRQYDSGLTAKIDNEEYPRSEPEILFRLCNEDVLKPPRRRGSPSGRHVVDCVPQAASYAWSIRRDNQCSKRKAVEQAFKSFDRKAIGKKAGESTIFATSDEAAKKRIYEALAEIEKTEPAVIEISEV